MLVARFFADEGQAKAFAAGLEYTADSQLRDIAVSLTCHVGTQAWESPRWTVFFTDSSRFGPLDTAWGIDEPAE
jgi:hypothetical protein